MHKNTLADAVEKPSAGEIEYILNEAVKRPAERGVFQQGSGHFALDSTDLKTTEPFGIEELFILLEREPKTCWRVDPCEVRRRYGLEAPAIA